MSTVAVVTGAGRGLGRKIAERLARKGHHVVVTDIDEGAAQVTAALIDGTAFKQDVRDPDSHRAIARAAAERGKVVVWVNNAGVLDAGEAWDMQDAISRRMVEVNLLGVIWGCNAALEVMTEGSIINIASISALSPTPGLAVYGATKHGVLGYSLSLAGELMRAKKLISVSALCPDAMESEMTKAVEHDKSAGLLFANISMLSHDEVADAAIELVQEPKLVRTLPTYRAAIIHLLRPFPSLSLPLLKQLGKLGRGKLARSRRSDASK
ncbi:MAG: SDR family NAD(P)-dependent oxidoreductase [Kofleriaceae bacterium]